MLSKEGVKSQSRYENVSGRVGDAVQGGKGLVETAGERIGVIGTNTTETAKSANDLASKEAGHWLGNAKEMLGDKIEDVGKGIKLEK
jgi:hypothetical protein